MKPLSLAVDARVVAQDTRGIGRYERAILRRLAQRDDVELTLLVPEFLAALRKPQLRAALGSGRFHVARRADDRRNHLIWHPANGTFFRSSLPSIVTMHDAVPFRYPPADAAARAAAQEPFLLSARTATAFITPSAFGKREIVEVFGLNAERVEVIYHGVEPTFTPGPADALPPQVQAPYLLFVGDPLGEPRKNFDVLYHAHRLTWPDGIGPRIVVAGSRDPKLDGVVYAGEVGDDLTGRENTVLRSLYRGALALTMPSYHETFGMPLIEAMACATPVIASDASCLPEIGGDAALYAKPHDPADWAVALRRIADDEPLREQLSKAGLERAAQFSWERSVDEHLALFARVAKS